MLSIKDRGERKPDVVKPIADPDTVAALDKLLRWDVNLAKKDNEKYFYQEDGSLNKLLSQMVFTLLCTQTSSLFSQI